MEKWASAAQGYSIYSIYLYCQENFGAFRLPKKMAENSGIMRSGENISRVGIMQKGNRILPGTKSSGKNFSETPGQSALVRRGGFLHKDRRKWIR
jgi:hypothetical protein